MKLPTLKSIIICDQIIDDVVTRKKTLVGIFERIFAPQFPMQHGAMGIFFQLTGATGDFDFSMELADLHEDRVLGVAELPRARMENAAVISSFALVFQGLRFDHPGTYEFRLWCNKELIGQLPLNVIQVQAGTA